MLVFNNYFYKNRKLKLHFGDRVAVLNVFLYQTGGSIHSTCSNYRVLIQVLQLSSQTVNSTVRLPNSEEVKGVMVNCCTISYHQPPMHVASD
jgi:hypothetical protein